MFQIKYARRVDGAKTAFGTLGEGPVLLIPPGQLSHIEWWSEAPGFAAALSALSKHRTVVIYDRHGCGLSDRDRTVFTAEDDMLDIEAVVAALDCKAIDLLGISFGTGPAVRFAVEVLRLIALGRSNQQIAAELVISLNTVLRHVSNIFVKTGSSNRTEAAAYAHRHGIT
jgi:pimeloyl-ACP methyl ester carboxylesterase